MINCVDYTDLFLDEYGYIKTNITFHDVNIFTINFYMHEINDQDKYKFMQQHKPE